MFDERKFEALRVKKGEKETKAVATVGEKTNERAEQAQKKRRGKQQERGKQECTVLR